MSRLVIMIAGFTSKRQETMKNFKAETSFAGNGIIIFDKVVIALKAERFLKEAGYAVKTVIPPDEMCMHCELGVTFRLADKAAIEGLLHQKGLGYTNIYLCGGGNK
jgi:hypothetical protein